MKSKTIIVSIILLFSAILMFISCGPKQDKIEKYTEDGVEVIVNHLEPYRIEKEPARLYLEEQLRIDTESEVIAESARKRELTGREVEIAFLNAMEISFSDEERPTSTADVLETIAEVVPVINSYKAQIENLRAWGKDKRQASEKVTTVTAKPTDADKKLQSLM